MNNPFKVGDKVFTPEGEFFVGHACQTGCYIGRNTDHNGSRYRWTPTDFLSFTPWTCANHERPREEGWWVVKANGEAVVRQLRAVDAERLYDSDGVVRGITGAYTFHKYLGKDWK